MRCDFLAVQRWSGLLWLGSSWVGSGYGGTYKFRLGEGPRRRCCCCVGERREGAAKEWRGNKSLIKQQPAPTAAEGDDGRERKKTARDEKGAWSSDGVGRAGRELAG